MRVILIPVKKILTPQVRVKEELALGKVRVIFCVNVIVAGGRSALRPH